MVDSLALHFKDRTEIYFPPGSPGEGGSCDFQTPLCRANCNLKQNRLQRAALAFFRDNSPTDIVFVLLDESSRVRDPKEPKYVEWFVTGDCPMDLTNKCFEVIRRLHEKGVHQNGFTRNLELWKAVNALGGIPFALTVEVPNAAKKMSLAGLTTCPDYHAWRTTIFKGGQEVAMCWGIVETNGKIYPEDCVMCRENKRGCWQAAA